MKNRPPKHLPILPLVIAIVVVISVIGVYRLVQQGTVLGTSDTSAIRESYIPIGAGSAASSEWIDVGGASVWITSTLQGTVKKATFEASLVVPQGNQTASVRLYNASDKHLVWYSEMNLPGSGPALLISSPVRLDSGTKLYQVQVKSQLGGTATVLQARLHLQTQ